MSKLKNLSDIQILMQKAVQQKIAPAELMDIILEKPPISISQRLKIYQDAHRIRLLESLRDDFSRVKSSIGNEEFDVLALDYINRNPSHFQNLAEYSEGLPSFVQERHPELSKTAVTDWFELLSMHARAPENQMTPAEIQTGRAFKVKILPSTFFKGVQGTFIVVYRNQNEVETRELEDSLFRLLQFLQIERSLDEVTAFSQANAIHDEVVAGALHDWIKKEIIYCQPFK